MAGILSYLTGSLRGRNLRVVAWLLGVLVVLVAVYTGIFHVLMEREDREHSWATGIYWTMTTMSTLGFGDITFTSDAGRIFSVVVLISGALFILVLLPFAFIQFVFLPWMSWRDENRAPRELPPETNGHIVLTGPGAVTDAVVRRARRSGVPYVLIEPDRPTALSLHDAGYRVMVGDPDSPDAYRRARVEQAALVAATRSDTANTNIAFTVREIDETVPVVATASAAASVDILELAGADHVIQLGEVLGQAVARRVLGRSGVSQVVGRFHDLLVAEASAVHDDLLGRTLAESQVRQRVNVNVVGIWERGTYKAAGPETLVTPGAVLILAGSAQQLAAYDAAFTVPDAEESQVMIIGAGRVGRAAARDLDAAGVPFKIVDKREDRIRDPAHFVLGDAAELEVLEKAGLRESSAVLITTHDDDVNVYLTIYCRRLEPDIQIISRANVDRNVGTLHRAGADAVLSYASLGASAIWNALGPNDVLVLAEGLVVFRVPTPRELAGRTLADSMLRQHTGVTVVALALGEEMLTTNPGHDTPLPPDADLILIADEGAEQRFLERYPTQRSTT
ncbi:MAG: potassium channel family protein [Actinomycetota bacterium]